MRETENTKEDAPFKGGLLNSILEQDSLLDVIIRILQFQKVYKQSF